MIGLTTVAILFAILTGSYGYTYIVPASLKTPGICFYNGHALPKGDTQLATGCQQMTCNEDGSIMVQGCSPISLPNCTLIKDTTLVKTYPDCCEMTYQCTDSDGNTYIKQWNQLKIGGVYSPFHSLIKESATPSKIQAVKEEVIVPYSFIVPASIKNPGICFMNGHVLPSGESQLPTGCQHMFCNEDGSILVEGCSPMTLPNCTLIEGTGVGTSFPDCCTMTYQCLDTDGNLFTKQIRGGTTKGITKLVASPAANLEKVKQVLAVPYTYIVPASIKTPGICFYNGHVLPQGDSQLPMGCQHMVCNPDGSITVEGCSPSTLPNCTLIKDVSSVTSYPDCCVMTYECLDVEAKTYTKKLGGITKLGQQNMAAPNVQKVVEDAGIPYSFIVPASLKTPGICFLNGHVLPKGDNQLPTGCQHMVCNEDGSILIEGCSPEVLPNCTLIEDNSTPFPDCCAMTYQCVDVDGKMYMKKLSGTSSKTVSLFQKNPVAPIVNKVVDGAGVPYAFIVPASLKNPGICFLNGHVLPMGDNQLPTGCQHMMCNADGSILIEGCSPAVLPNCTLIPDATPYPDCCAMTYECLDVTGNTYIKKLSGTSNKNIQLGQQNMVANVQKVVEDAGIPYAFIVPGSLKNPGICFYNGHVLPKGESQLPTGCQHMVCNEDGSTLIEGCSPVVLPNCTLIEDGTSYPDCCAMTYQCVDSVGNTFVKKIGGGANKSLKLSKPNMVAPYGGVKTTGPGRGYAYIIPASLRNPGVCFFNGHILAKGDNKMPTACQNMRCNEDGSITVQGCGRISLPNCVLIEGANLGKSYPDCCEMTYQCMDINGNKYTKQWNQLNPEASEEQSEAVSIISPIILQLMLI